MASYYPTAQEGLFHAARNIPSPLLPAHPSPVVYSFTGPASFASEAPGGFRSSAGGSFVASRTLSSLERLCGAPRGSSRESGLGGRATRPYTYLIGSPCAPLELTDSPPEPPTSPRGLSPLSERPRHRPGPPTGAPSRPPGSAAVRILTEIPPHQRSCPSQHFATDGC